MKEKFAATRERYSILTSVSWNGLAATEDRLAAKEDEPAHERDSRLAASEDGFPASGNLEAEHPGADENGGPLPKFAIMFKGAPDGTIVHNLYQTCDVPPICSSKRRSVALIGRRTWWKPWIECFQRRSRPKTARCSFSIGTRATARRR